MSIVALLAACSLQEVERVPCTTVGDECRALFGLGSVCESDGYCSEQKRIDRCQETYPGDLFSASIDLSEVVVLGSLFDLGTEVQKARRNAVKLALDEINGAGALDEAIPGMRDVERLRFGLVSCDLAGATSTETAIEVATYLTNTLGAPALIGPASSADVYAIFSQLPDDVFVGSPSATSEVLTDIDETQPTDDQPGRLWRTVPPDLEQGAVVARDMQSRGVARVAAIAQSGAYGEGLYAGFLDVFGIASLHTFGAGQRLDTAIEDAGLEDVEEVLFIASSIDDVVTFLEAAAEHPGFADKNIFLTDSAGTNDTVSRSPAQLFGQIRGTRHSLDMTTAVYDVFSSNYKGVFHGVASDYSFTAQAYDMAWIVALGAGWAQRHGEPITGLNIARGARHLSDGDNVPLLGPLWVAALRAFKRDESINILGASGPLDYDPATEETTGAIEVWTIDTTRNPPEIITAPPLPTPSVMQTTAASPVPIP